MPRKRRSTKSRIVKAAWNLFFKNGYDRTTVDDIIAASKTSKGTFYHYFKGKEALLNSLSYLFDEKYEELAAVIDPNLSAYDKLLFLNHELFYMIETSIDIKLLAYLYSSQLITKDKKSLSDQKRFYFKWVTEILAEVLKKGTVVCVQGSLSYREVELANGYKGRSASIAVEDLQILANPHSAQGNQSRANARSSRQSAPVPQDSFPNEDIPC